MFTAAERRGAFMIVLLMALGTCWDLWHAHRPPRAAAGGNSWAPADTAAQPGPPIASAVESHVPPGSRKTPPATPLDLNRADATQLACLPGIGPKLAVRIVEARRERGEFRRMEDLLAVRGIGPRLYARLRPYLALGSARSGGGSAVRAFRTTSRSDSVQILLQSAGPTFR